MSQSVLVIGESGTGKSTSLRNLPPEETFILNVVGKPLPFRNSKSAYTQLSSDGSTGNYYATDKPAQILKLIKLINEVRTEIKYLVFDDYGYIMTNSFMSKALDKGYGKFAELSKSNFDIMHGLNYLRDDLFCFVFMHTQIDEHGKYKPKTVGKMTDQHDCVEGRFTYVFHSLITDDGYKFLTNNDGVHMAKTPIDMFLDTYIENDLILIVDQINKYFDQDVDQ